MPDTKSPKSKPALDDKAMEQLQKRFPEIKKDVDAFLHDGVTKTQMQHDVNSITAIFLDSVDRTDGKADGKISKKELKLALARLLDSPLGNSAMNGMQAALVDSIVKSKDAGIESKAALQEKIELEAAKSIARIFKADTNKDGKISAVEIAFDKFDDDKNGKISVYEAAKHVGDEPGLLKGFIAFDKNKDMNISKKEAQAIIDHVSKNVMSPKEDSITRAAVPAHGLSPVLKSTSKPFLGK